MTLFSPYTANEGSVTYPRDASFSSYLDTTERDFVRSLAHQSVNTPSPTREIFTPRQSVENKSNFRARRSGELDVFGAHKYFSEKIIKDDHYPRDFRIAKRDDFLERKSSKSNVISATSSSTKSPSPSLKSGRSFNSQIGLLLPKKGFVGHKIFSGFQCKGFCFDKKSVSTTHTQHIVQSSSKSCQNNGNWDMKNRIISHQQHFAFPIIDTTSISLDDDVDYDQSCNKSMDGFEFHQLGKQETEQNLENKNHSILAWNAIPNPPTVTTPFPFPLQRETSFSCKLKDEDECSDTSSDLFEIETLTGVPCIQTPTTPYYEPSEGSIQWSVVTASDAADNFADLLDDHHHKDDHKTAITIERRKVQKSSTLGGMFLGCTNHKAIDVVENRYNNQS